MNKKMEKMIIAFLVVVGIAIVAIIIADTSSNSSSNSHYSAKPGECIYCDGVGWYMGADRDGKMTIRKTCPHCHGTGLAN